MLHVKDHTLKDNPVLFCRNLDHRSDLGLVQLRFSRSLLSLEVKSWLFFNSWWRSHLGQGFHSPQGLFIGCLEDLFIFLLKARHFLLCQLLIRLHPTGEMWKTKGFQLLGKIGQMVLTKMFRINRRRSRDDQFLPFRTHLQVLVKSLKALTSARSFLKNLPVVGLQQVSRKVLIGHLDGKGRLVSCL